MYKSLILLKYSLWYTFNNEVTDMLNIGEKIKQYRKERKMTLAEVAGDRLTKGMLSLIENGKAQPSMESLQHIAKQLGIDVSELMQSKTQEEIKSLYVQVEKQNAELNKEYNIEKHDQKALELYNMIEPYFQNGQLKGESYEEVRIYEVYLTLRFLLKKDLSEKPFLPLISMYEKVHAYSKIVRIYNKMGSIKFLNHEYEEAMNYLYEGEHYINLYGDLIDKLEKLDVYYNLTVISAALNDDRTTEHYLEVALKIAKEEKILYRLNDFYRFLFYIHVLNEEGDKAHYYLKKIHAFAEIMEEPTEYLMEQLLTLVYMNQIEKNYEKVITQKFDKVALPNDVNSEFRSFLNGEYAYAYLMLERYDEALELLHDIVILDLQKHPIDLIHLYRTFAIRALCYLEKGEIENAKRDILYAIDGVKDFSDNIDKQFIKEAYDRIIG